MSFGFYIHIPYCLQKCHYCDFTTFALNHEVSMAQYTQLILTELRTRAQFIPEKSLSSIYFGGGTPSLLPAADILTILREIASCGFTIKPEAEITIEINPGTVSKTKLDLYLDGGVNRFSVGVQTFNPRFLAACGREHSAQDSRDTLQLLRENNVNYSLIYFWFAEPIRRRFAKDLAELAEFSPPHVSLYNLTIPQSHKMNVGRAPDAAQAEMFGLIGSALAKMGLARYELSNFAKPGAESQHNRLYWSDQSYWGLGVSAHSYLRHLGHWGTRFWNPSSAKDYIQQLQPQTKMDKPFFDSLPARQLEALKTHEALTDYCHTQLRMMRGISNTQFLEKFGPALFSAFTYRANKLILSGLLDQTSAGYALSSKGLPLANQVFLEFTFLSDEIP